MSSTLKRQSSRAFLIATVIPFALACLGLAFAFLAWSRQASEVQLTTSVTEVAARLDLYVGQHVAVMESLAAMLAANHQGDQSGLSRGLQALHARQAGFLTLTVADPDGRVMAASVNRGREAGEVGTSIADREYFRRAGESSGAFVSPAFIGRGRGNDVIVAISQTYDWGDGRSGIVQGALDLSLLDELLRPGGDSGQDILIADGNGLIVASTAGGFSPLVHSLDALLAQGAHDRYIVSVVDADTRGWRIAGFFDRSALYRPVLVLAAVLVGTVLTSLLLASVLYGRLLGPVLKWVSGVAESLSRSRIEAMAVPQLPAGHTEELARLARSISELLDTVRRQRDELKAGLESLESRVEERTREVEERNRQLQFSRTLLEQFVRQAPVAIALLDHQMRFVEISDRWIDEFRLGERAVVGHRFREVLPGLPEVWKERFEQCLSGQGHRIAEEALPMSDGAVHWVSWAMDPWHEPDGSVGGCVMMAEFVTDQKRFKDQLEHLADHDALTGLLNRRAFVSALEETLARSDCGRRALLFVDLNDFKQVNDKLGHAAGDDVLRLLADRLKVQSRAGDVAGRLGGDEFVILSTVESSKELVSVAERYRRMLRMSMNCKQGQALISVSVGATMLSPGQSVDELLEKADRYMYADKRAHS
ncbi:MAG: diguanylate cyclase [Pseudomonadota bacterium]